MLKYLYGALIIAKGSKMYGLYVLGDSIDIDHASITSQDFHDEIKLWQTC